MPSRTRHASTLRRFAKGFLSDYYSCLPVINDHLTETAMVPDSVKLVVKADSPPARQPLIYLCPFRGLLIWASRLFLFASGLGGNVFSEDRIAGPLEGYATFSEVEARLMVLSESPYAKLSSLGQTLGQRDVWLLTVSQDPGASQPAIVVLGNVVGSHLLGRELALRMAESVVKNADSDQAIADLMARFTFYFITSPTPDASEKNFELPSGSHDGNLTSTDDDRDFSFGEDPPQDLNGDGWVTMMRVAEQFGTHRTHPSDPRILIPIDKKKGEIGGYRLLVESLDADSDENFGEDGSSGVDFNRNFTFNYEFFGRSSGPHQVSERESRAVADFLFDHPNIAAVFCFTPEDNLFHPWKGSPQTDAARIKTKVLTEDQRFLEQLADVFKKLHGGKSAPTPPSGAGSFSEWSYFHFGRWTFASRGWWVPMASAENGKVQDTAAPVADDSSGEATVRDGVADSPDSPEKAKQDLIAEEVVELKGEQEAKTEKQQASIETLVEQSTVNSAQNNLPSENPPLTKDDKRGAEDLNALAWFKSKGIEAFVEWQPFSHPHLPGKTVEIGGFKPHALMNPPHDLIEPLVTPHVEFLKEVLLNLPKIEIHDIKVDLLGPGLVDVSCSVVNVGRLPTMPLMGSTNRQWYPIQVELAGTDAARWIQGSPRQSVGRLSELGGRQELRWVFLMNQPQIHARELTIIGSAPTLHSVTATVEIPVTPP